MLFLCVFGISQVLLGISFLGYEHYTQYGFLHIMSTFTAVALPFVLRILVPDKDKSPRFHKAILYTLSAVILFFTLFKFTYIYKYDYSLYEVLPLNICNLAAVFICIRPFWKNRQFDNYILCFGLLGGFFNLILGTRYGLDQNFFTDIVYESNLTHNLFFTYCLYAFVSGEIRPNVRASLLNMCWLTPLFGVFVFTNQIFQFNFFFTSVYQNPILSIYNLFPTFRITLFQNVFEINLLYYLLVLLASTLTLGLLVFGLDRAATRYSSLRNRKFDNT